MLRTRKNDVPYNVSFYNSVHLNVKQLYRNDFSPLTFSCMPSPIYELKKLYSGMACTFMASINYNV
jgi:hypothetical protein